MVTKEQRLEEEQRLQKLKNLITMSYDDIDNMVADFQDTEAHAYLLSASDIVDELAELSRAKSKVCYIISIAIVELRNLIEYAYTDADDMITDFENTEAHAYLQSALDIVDELE